MRTYTCSCRIGFTGEFCSTNIDDCEGINCLAGQLCFDEIDNYECRCPDGYTGK